jgi:hypothetical protein
MTNGTKRTGKKRKEEGHKSIDCQMDWHSEKYKKNNAPAIENPSRVNIKVPKIVNYGFLV